MNEIILKAEFVEEFLCLKGWEIDSDSHNIKMGVMGGWLKLRGTFGPVGGAAT